MVKTVDGIMNSQGLIISDSDIVKKALTDFLITRDLEASKDQSKIGIEGVIIDDYLRNRNKVTDINLEIANLSGSEEDKIKNKEQISELKNEAKVYKENAENIINGTDAEKYYKQAIFYLNKNISEE
jgi:hypothetical protein